MGQDHVPPPGFELWYGASHPIAFATLTVSLLIVEKILESDK
jgi:hypothetical protein